MRTKDSSVECQFHPRLTEFLASYVDLLYRDWGDEVIITSGSELGAVHSHTSLHYSGQAADIRGRQRDRVPDGRTQIQDIKAEAFKYCVTLGIPANWIDVVASNHGAIHCEYQPKGP